MDFNFTFQPSFEGEEAPGELSEVLHHCPARIPAGKGNIGRRRTTTAEEECREIPLHAKDAKRLPASPQTNNALHCRSYDSGPESGSGLGIFSILVIPDPDLDPVKVES